MDDAASCPGRRRGSRLAILSLVSICLVLGGFFVLGRSDGVAAWREPSAREVGPQATTLGATNILTYQLNLPIVFKGFEAPFPSIFGVQLYGGISEQATALSLARYARVHWARWPISWASIEPTNRLPADYNWYLDASVRNAHAAGLNLIVEISNNPAWAATYSNGPIDKVDLQEFVQFVTALVERYDGDGVDDAPGSPVVKHWEFYNEPDAGVELNAAEYGASYWGPFGDEYADMLCAVYGPVKAANPEARVVFGGVAYDSFIDGEGRGAFVREFLGDVLAAGGGDCFDVMNFHYYPPFASVWADYGPGMLGKVNHLRDNYDIAGKPLIVTEAGWHSEDYSVYQSTPQMQSRYVIRLFTQAKVAGLDALSWWTWIDPGGGYGPNGLLNEELETKPAYYAYRDAAARLGRASFEAALDAGADTVEVYRFSSDDGQPFYVAWSNDDSSHTVLLPLSRAHLVDMYGDVLDAVHDRDDGSANGQIRVTFGRDPIYVEGY